MIANFFNKSKPVNMIYILVMLLVYFIIHCFIVFNNEYIATFLLKNSGIFLINIWILFLVNFIISKNKLIHNNYFPLLIIVMLSGIFPETMFESNLILSNLFLLLSFRKIFSLKNQTNTTAKIFDSGFWIGVATLFFSWSILFLLLVYISIIIYKKASFKSVCIPIIGFTTPIFINYTYLFYFDNLSVFYTQFNFLYSFNFETYFLLKTLIPSLYLAVVLIWSVISVTPKYLLVNNAQKSSWIIVLWLLIISLSIVVIAPLKNYSELIFILFPSGIIIGNFLQKKESSLLKNGILYLFLLISVIVYFL